MTILIKNISVLTMIDEEILENQNICINKDKIIYIGQEIPKFNYSKIIEGKNKLVMPGLINAHTHLGMSLLRNYADDLPLHEWLNNKIWPIEAKLTGEYIYWGSLLSMIEMIKTGTTTYCDMYFFMDEVAKATKDIKMRGILTRGMVEDPKNANISLNETEELFTKYHNSQNERIKVMVAPHSPYTCSTDFLKESIALAKKLDTGINIHLSETKKEVEDSINEFNLSPIKRMKELGMFEIHTIAAHCVHVNEEDLDIIKNNKVYPVYNPISNLKLASGFAPIDTMLKKDIPVSLGTDGASSNNNLNMFEEIKLSSILNKALNKDATSVSAFDALKMATVNGAKALGIDHLVGTIEVGKKADLIILDLDKAHMYPRNNLISALVYSANGSDVDTVLIDGNVVMENRNIINLDEYNVIKKVKKLGKELLNN